MRHPGLAELAKAEYSFESDDGNSRFLFLKRNKGQDWGYKDDSVWVEQVKSALSEWNTEYDNMFTFGLTGGPVYNSEVGSGMEQDMVGTVSVTLAIIALLFLVMQRSLAQLMLLITLVAATFFLTLGIAGWFMPSMNVLSIAFAAILLGLIIDYAVVLLREARE